MTGMEISDLSDDVSEGVKSAGQVVKQVDQSLDSARKQAQKAQVTTKSVFVGVKAAWSSLTQSSSTRRPSERLSPSQRKMRSSRLQKPSFDQNRVDPLTYHNLENPYQQSNNTPHQSNSEDFEQPDTDE